MHLKMCKWQTSLSWTIQGVPYYGYFLSTSLPSERNAQNTPWIIFIAVSLLIMCISCTPQLSFWVANGSSLNPPASDKQSSLHEYMHVHYNELVNCRLFCLQLMGTAAAAEQLTLATASQESPERTNTTLPLLTLSSCRTVSIRGSS